MEMSELYMILGILQKGAVENFPVTFTQLSVPKILHFVKKISGLLQSKY
jgi:hypothetical protein